MNDYLDTEPGRAPIPPALPVADPDLAALMLVHGSRCTCHTCGRRAEAVGLSGDHQRQARAAHTV
jgi:hypothetical protein